MPKITKLAHTISSKHPLLMNMKVLAQAIHQAIHQVTITIKNKRNLFSIKRRPLKEEKNVAHRGKKEENEKDLERYKQD